MDRLVIPPKRVTSPTWGSLPPRKQALRMDKLNIKALVQSIERPYHLIYKNVLSIKQQKKIGLNLFKESRRSSPLCVRQRLQVYIYPRRPEVMVGRDREWKAYRQVCGQRGRNLTMTIAIHLLLFITRKIRNHLRETATNSAKIHSLARKYEHMRINQFNYDFCILINIQ